ncbi:MAG: glycerol kinase, partial [Oscillospiraceae bacterium]|nr:glycerol kinase [Oscillospiraceae bacterium]
FLMQFQSDISGITIQRPKCIETTALGAAYLAGLSVGYWRDTDEVRENWQCGRVFGPHLAPGDKDKLLKGWRRAVRCARYWANEEETEDV